MHVVKVSFPLKDFEQFRLPYLLTVHFRYRAILGVQGLRASSSIMENIKIA